jgi:hypothetical protein
MKSARFPRIVSSSTLFALALLVGCGGASNLVLAPGNWAVTAVSSGGNGTYYIGGNLTQSGSNVLGTMHVVNSLCFDVSQQLAFTGTVKGKQVTLTSASYQGQVITVVASGTTGSALTGTYSVTVGTNCSGDKGSVNANAMPSISGTWSGPLGDPSDPNATLSIALTQANTASPDGTFALSGALTYQNSICANSGTITSGSMAGLYIIGFNATTDTGDSVFYNGGILDSTTNPKNITTGTYSYGTCDNNIETPTFTKH